MFNKTSPVDMELIRSAVGEKNDSPQTLPFSFALDGKKYYGLPATTHKISRIIDANIVETVFTADIGMLRVTAECLRYLDFPVFEWTVYIKNNGNADSQTISDFLGIDALLPLKNPFIWHNNGDFCSPEGYETVCEPLKSYTTACVGGRPCDRAFPYFRLTGEGYGYNLAIGWPGQWSASFEADGEGVRIKAGQETFRARLHPGETARSPRITVTAFEGDYERGVNAWRRWYISHVLPRTGGNLLTAKNCAHFHGGDESDEFVRATEENQIAAIDRFISRGYKPDIWWIDAGWYPCKNDRGQNKWYRTGNWKPDPERFPRGLKPIGEHCEKKGVDFLLWFEPERVRLEAEYLVPREYLIFSEKNEHHALLWLGNNKACKWLTELVDGIIKEGKISIYRQDFNFEPLPYWQDHDEEGRQGISENLHVQGYLRYYDDLLDKNPGLWIDSCASGGRRNDLETMRRAVPLHPTDYGYGNHPVKQAFYNALFAWIPYFRAVAVSYDDENGIYTEFKTSLRSLDNFRLHNAFAPVASGAVTVDTPDSELEYFLKFEGIRKRAAKYMLSSDFYALTPVNKNSGDWYAVQFHDEERGSGVVEAIRNVKCEDESVKLKLRALDSERNYIFESPEFGKNVEISGRELEKSGFTVSLPKRTGETWFYKPIE